MINIEIQKRADELYEHLSNLISFMVAADSPQERLRLGGKCVEQLDELNTILNEVLI